MRQSSQLDGMEVLTNPAASLAQIMQALAEVEKTAAICSRTHLGLSASTTVDLLGVFLRRQAVLAGVRPTLTLGNYDDPIGDIDLFEKAGVDHVVLVPFFDNLLPAFEAQLGRLAPEAVVAKEVEMRFRYRLVFEKAGGFKTVFLCLFHRFGAPVVPGADDPVAAAVVRFNQSLRDEAATFANVHPIDMDDIVRSLGRAAAFDPRFYFRGKAPYTAAFLAELARRLDRASRGFGSYFHKAVVLDCDNTLWGGVVGEDLLTGIKLGPFDYPGNIYWRVQHEFAELERNGILLCLCSKNNPDDVDEVLRSHPEMVLKDQHIVLKKVNWNNKPQNLREIAQELNIGLDSLIFVDDSEFECAAVRSQLPMVRTVQVPKVLSDYPRVVQEIKELCLAGGISADSRSKTGQYRARAEAESLEARFGSHEDYLKSLELKVVLTRNARANIPRISELTQKSNQFNLTTRRYGEGEIVQAMEDPDTAVYSLVVSDKFGDAGLTGVAVVRYAGSTAHVDAFLMSCRVIGRGVETSIWRHIAAQAAQDGCTHLEAQYQPTAKNAQVADFYDRLSLPLINEVSGVRRYGIALDRFAPPLSPWIEVSYAG
jgi:FkbH-like protein